MGMPEVKEQFISTYRQYVRRFGSEQLLSWLCSTDFFEAPASTRFHSSFAGGLALHSLYVFRRMANNCVGEYQRKYGSTALPQELTESVAVVALLHDVCKANFYKTDYKNKKIYSENGSKRDAAGCFDWESVPYYTVEDPFPLGHGEKSVFLINEHMRLSRDEALAIRFHMGDFSDRNTGQAYDLCPLAIQLHIADLQAPYLDEVRQPAQQGST